MSEVRGVIALMGSGELTGTMVETHKSLIATCGGTARAVFLDTPAGFQLNADLIAAKARDFFLRQVGHPMEIASFKSAETVTPDEAEKAYKTLGEADFVLMGPGSPTYAVRHLVNTPIPAILSAMVARGGCLVAASAAALTLGSHTLPVYEIYKVGDAPHWLRGLNLLKILGGDVVVIPHWNNAEGGNHDTRFCYMGEPRFQALEAMLPEGTKVLGVDEHTACVLDFSRRTATVRGIGHVIVRSRGRERVLGRGDTVDLGSLLDLDGPDSDAADKLRTPSQSGAGKVPKESFWDRTRWIEDVFRRAVAQNDSQAAVSLLLEMDGRIWQAQKDGESPEFISQAREVFREMVVHAGSEAGRAASSPDLIHLVEEIIILRERYRKDRKWEEADELRRCLQRAGVVLEDTVSGPRWRISDGRQADQRPRSSSEHDD